MRTLLLATLLAASAALAQGERGAIPLGQSRDGARPSDGAITGGTILPGESGGVPGAKPLPWERERRCMELGGTLREECLLNERSATGGGTAAPDPRVGTPPRTTPPPQNPR